MRKILKYHLEEMDFQTIDIPIPAKLLSVLEEELAGLVIYAMVDDELQSISVDIRIVETGDTILDDIDNYVFLGTVKSVSEKTIHIFGRHSKENKTKEFSGIKIEEIPDTNWQFKNKERIETIKIGDLIA